MRKLVPDRPAYGPFLAAWPKNNIAARPSLPSHFSSYRLCLAMKLPSTQLYANTASNIYSPGFARQAGQICFSRVATHFACQFLPGTSPVAKKTRTTNGRARKKFLRPRPANYRFAGWPAKPGFAGGAAGREPAAGCAAATERPAQQILQAKIIFASNNARIKNSQNVPARRRTTVSSEGAVGQNRPVS